METAEFPNQNQPQDLDGVIVNLDLESGKDIVIKPTSTNRSLGSQLVFYNRVPKCGSTTTMRVAKSLSQLNHATIIHGT